MKKFVPLILLFVVGVTSWLYRAEIRDFWFPPETTLILCGNIEDRQVNLTFTVSERISELLVEEGDIVKKGDLLGRLETVRLEKNLAVAQAALDVARENLRKAENGSRPEEIEMSEAAVKASEARIAPAKSDYARQVELKKDNAVSSQSVEEAEATWLYQEAQAELARANLKMRRAGTRKEDIAIARAQVTQAEAECARIAQSIADTNLYAPCDGLVRRRVLEPGEMASPQTAVLKLAVLEPKWVRIYLPESLLSTVKQDSKAEVQTDGHPTSFEGWVGFISPTAEFTPKNVQTPELRTSLVYECRVYVRDPENRLKLGAPVTVVFPEIVTKNPQ